MEATGYKRSYSVVIRKMLNEVILSGYPKVYPTTADLDNGYFILGGAHIPIMTDNELQTFTQSEYNARIALLKDYVIQQEGMNPFANQFNGNVVYDPENCVPEVTTTTTEQGTTTTSTTKEPTTTTSTTTAAPPTTTTTTEVASTTTTEEAVTTTTTSSEVTTTTTTEPAITTTTTTEEVTTTTTTEGIASVEYGLLYNWYAATDARNIANVGWHVPTVFEYQSLADYLGAGGNYSTGSNTVGGKLKETGTTYWNSPNTGATNEVGFNGRGGGNRGFGNILNSGIFWDTTVWFAGTGNAVFLYYDGSSFACPSNVGQDRASGYSIRLIKDSTTLAHGQTGTYTDPSGFTYRTICINDQELVADNIKTQHYRNGDLIPEVTDGTTWSGLTSGALCAYNNDWNNV